jgi:hypothetical protein
MTGPAFELGRIVDHRMFGFEQWGTTIHAQPGTILLSGSTLTALELTILLVPDMGIAHPLTLNPA